MKDLPQFFGAIETNSATDKVKLEFPEHMKIMPVEFPSMVALGDFADSITQFVEAWRADERFENLTDIRKRIADTVVVEMKKTIAKTNKRAAERFPDDVYMGKKFNINVVKLDYGEIQATIEVHVKMLIEMFANIFSAIELALENEGKPLIAGDDAAIAGLAYSLQDADNTCKMADLSEADRAVYFERAKEIYKWLRIHGYVICNEITT